MPKKKKKREPRPAPMGPPKAIKDFAKSYRCSHCHSRVTEIVQSSSRMFRVMVAHDNGCPVLTGTLPDVPDAVRAAMATGHIARVIGGPNSGAPVD